jgi:hypothetical protein
MLSRSNELKSQTEKLFGGRKDSYQQDIERKRRQSRMSELDTFEDAANVVMVTGAVVAKMATTHAVP